MVKQYEKGMLEFLYHEDYVNLVVISWRYFLRK